MHAPLYYVLPPTDAQALGMKAEDDDAGYGHRESQLPTLDAAGSEDCRPAHSKVESTAATLADSFSLCAQVQRPKCNLVVS